MPELTAANFDTLLADGLLATNVETLSANKTLKATDATVQSLDPNGSGRTITLPSATDVGGRFFLIANTADAAEVLTVQDAGSNTIVTPTQNEAAAVWSDGTNWHGIVGAES